MKAIILAAGLGERLGEITKFTPKPMIKINDKPILEHNIEWLKSYGINDIYINLHHLPDHIINYFGNGDNFKVRINYSFEPKLLGTAGAVAKMCRDFHELNEESFLVIYGDNLLKYNIHEIKNFHETKKSQVTIAVYKKDDVSQSGIVVMQSDGRIIQFIEKPKPEEAVSNLVNTGIYILEKEILRYLSDEQYLDFGKDVFPKIIDNQQLIYGFLASGSLTAIDTPELLTKTIESCL